MTARLPDLLGPGLGLVVCGTAASSESARRRQYYAGPGNRFWAILAETRLTPRVLEPYEYASLLDFGIGLTDVVKDQHGGDAEIEFRGYGGELPERLRPHAPRWLCFNGKRAAQVALGRARVEYGTHEERFGATRVFVAPSTSGAARRYWSGDRWHELAALVRHGG